MRMKHVKVICNYSLVVCNIVRHLALQLQRLSSAFFQTIEKGNVGEGDDCFCLCCD
jgi:hypothetical protein